MNFIYIIYKIKKDGKNNPDPLIQRMEKQPGIHIVEWAEKIGMGTRKYTIVPLDK